MISRILKKRLERLPKSILLLGPRQVGKSTLCRELAPGLTINLADEVEFSQYLKDPGRLRRVVEAQEFSLVMIDEIQRIPALLNSIQAILDEGSKTRYLLTGSSARKLKRGKANLLPGRLFVEYLSPLIYWEIQNDFDLNKALTKGCLPEVYLHDYGLDLLESYVSTYLKEEIQSEALTKDLGSYSRFIDIAAELSGQYINYSKLASDCEINKETIRRYFQILQDTLLVERISSFTRVEKARRARQKDRFFLFDTGVRNVLLGRHRASLSKEEEGFLFEQWIILQCIYYNRTFHKSWNIMSYRDHAGVEVDLLIQTPTEFIAVEIKSGAKVERKMFKNMDTLATLSGVELKKFVVFKGDVAERYSDDKLALPYKTFLEQVIPNL